MRSGVSVFRELRMSRQFLLMWRIDPNEFHRYWPSLIENEEAEFKRLELISWKDEVRDVGCSGRSVWPEEKRSDLRQTDTLIMNQRMRPNYRRCMPNSIASMSPRRLNNFNI